MNTVLDQIPEGTYPLPPRLHRPWCVYERVLMWLSAEAKHIEEEETFEQFVYIPEDVPAALLILSALRQHGVTSEDAARMLDEHRYGRTVPSQRYAGSLS